MGDRLRVIPFDRLVNWIFEEHASEKTIFGIAAENFYRGKKDRKLIFCGENLSSPIGPAAGPHTQLAQNLAAAYLTGGRFFELKTVQVIDRLSFPKPCINAEDECYNTEWSTELSVEEACGEYVKGWFLIHLLSKEYFQLKERSFIFNMSVGYDLAGIRSAKVDRFIEEMKDSSSSAVFKECRMVLKDEVSRFKYIDQNYIDSIEPAICNSISLSTMHGCPPAEIEAISRYLLTEKGLHTHVKLNPTLLGYQEVRKILDDMGYNYIRIKEETFTDDLSYDDAVPMLKKLITAAAETGREFGIKLSNTLPVLVSRGELPGDMMYMSGKPLYALTIRLAQKLASEFGGAIKISYSGGADRSNVARIIATGIWPVTVATTLLKPNGYQRLRRLAELIEPEPDPVDRKINLAGLNKLAAEAVTEPAYRKKTKQRASEKGSKKLPLFDCRDSCGICTAVCPNRANLNVRLESDLFKFDRQILHLDGMCNQCGNCATFCPELGKPYLEKLTAYRNEEDFNNSSNSGFLLCAEEPVSKLKIRINGEIKITDLNDLDQLSGGSDDPDAAAMICRIFERYQYVL